MTHIAHAFVSFYMKLVTEWDTLYDSSLAAQKASIVLKYVPFEGELNGFFKPAAKMLIEAMKNIACILTSDNTWELPSNIISYPHTNFQLQADIPADIITSSLKQKTIHHQMYLSNKLKKALGIRVLDASHMIEILRTANSTTVRDQVHKLSLLLIELESAALKKTLMKALESTLLLHVLT